MSDDGLRERMERLATWLEERSPGSAVDDLFSLDLSNVVEVEASGYRDGLRHAAERLRTALRED